MQFPQWHELIEKVNQFEKYINEERSKIADRFQIFKDNHPLYDKIISKAIDFLPSPFDKIAQFIYATFEGSEEEKCEQITEYFNDIKMRGEEHYDRLWFKLQDITKEIHDIKDLGNRESTVLQLIVEILTTSSITIKQKLDLLEKEIDLLIKTSKAGGIKPIKNKFELAKCYNVESNRVIEIRDSDLVNTKKWVEKWDWTDRKGKPILLITGDPGTGKSWLAYRLAYELMEDGYRVSRIIGTDIHQILIDSFEEESKNFSDIEKFVFVLDDSGISIGEINTPLTPDDIYNIIKTMTDQQQTFSGPLVLSMREETWNHIISGTKGRKGFMKSKIRELVEIKELHPLTEYETGKIIYSFYESVGDNIPYYQNLKVKQIAKKEIIKRSKGNPVIIRLFFVQMHHQSRGESYEITSLDTMQIISNATFYVSKQLFDYYINITDDKEKFSNALAFLYFIVKIGSLSVGHLTRIKEEVNQNYFTDQLWEYLLSLNDKRAFPLFNIDDLGIMLPFHDTVSHAIQQLVEHPEELESNTPADQEEIRACIRKIEDIDTDSSIREKSEKEFLKQYKYLIVKALDYYFDKRLNREINRRANISDETAYNFFFVIH